MEKIKAFYRAHKTKGLVVIIIALLTIILAPQSAKLISNSVEVAKEVKSTTATKQSIDKILDEIEKDVDKEPELKPKVLEAKEACEPTYILKTDDIFRDRNLVVLDLSTFEKTSEVTRNGETTIKYRRFGNLKQYYTVAQKAEYTIKSEDPK